jgi:hypothetical protein
LIEVYYVVNIKECYDENEIFLPAPGSSTSPLAVDDGDGLPTPAPRSANFFAVLLGYPIIRGRVI